MAALAHELDIDMAASYAYSDSATDLPMLEAVGHPVVVNPDRVLARIAKEREWEVRNFTHPVRLRDRMPAPSATHSAAAAGVVAAGGRRVARLASPPPRRAQRDKIVLMTDWVAWHAEYEDPHSRLSQRVAEVRRQLAAALDRGRPVRSASSTRAPARDATSSPSRRHTHAATTSPRGSSSSIRAVGRAAPVRRHRRTSKS